MRFRTVVRDWRLEPHHVRLLRLACEAWDRCAAAREGIERDGLKCLKVKLRGNDNAWDVARTAARLGHPVEEALLAQAQRLFRKLCPVCKRQADNIDRETLLANSIDPAFFEGVPIFEPAGCPKCNGIGYKGRGAIMEVLPISEAIRNCTIKGATSAALREIAVKEGMVTLKEAGLRKVRDGITSLTAALDVTGGE